MKNVYKYNINIALLEKFKIDQFNCNSSLIYYTDDFPEVQFLLSKYNICSYYKNDTVFINKRKLFFKNKFINYRIKKN